MKYRVFWTQHQWDDKPRPALVTDGMDLGDGYIKTDIVIDIEYPHSQEMTEILIKTFRSEQGKHQAAITELDHRINQLIAIEYKPAGLDVGG